MGRRAGADVWPSLQPQAQLRDMNKLNPVPSPARTSNARQPSNALSSTRPLSLLLALMVSTLSSCSSNHNEAQRERFAANQDDEDDSRVCVNEQTCTPDPGPKEMSQATCDRAEEGLEFHYVWRFGEMEGEGPEEKEKVDLNGNVRRVNAFKAREMYTYDDWTGYRRAPVGWEPVTEEVRRCGGEDHAFRMAGGPFLAWGGGFGGRVDWIYNAFCANQPDAPDFCPDDAEDFPVIWDVNNGSERAATWLDLTEWKGISFWARRGPDSQGGIRLAVADTNTDEDINFARYVEDKSEAKRS